MARKQVLRSAKLVVARGGAKVLRARGIFDIDMIVGPLSATAAVVAHAQGRLAALPPGFTDDLRAAPPFPTDAPEFLGGP